MLFSEVRGLRVVAPAGARPLGTVTSLTVDPASGAVSHLWLRGSRWGRETVLAWDAVHTIGPTAVRVLTATAPDTVPPRHDLLGRRVLTEAGTGHGTVRDVAFAPETGRILAVLTTRGEVAADRVLGLGDYALVVRAG